MKGDKKVIDALNRVLKNELTAKFSVSQQRLTTAGFGASRPKDRNDTLDGRARNRRVELVRLQ